MVANISRLPETVIGLMIGDIVPEGDVSLEILGVGIGDRPHFEEEVVAVGSSVVELGVDILDRLGTRMAEGRHKVEAMREE